MNKPKVAVASIIHEDEYPPKGTYAHAIEVAGGRPLFLGAVEEAEAALIAEEFDALLLTGGGDIGIQTLGVPLHEKAETVPLARDTTEVYLARAFLAARKPILAICRGEQVLNVAMGGTHNQHVFDDPNVTIAHQNVQTRHPVSVVPGTLLARIFGGAAQLTVNSTHHQAADVLAPDLLLNAMSPDGIIEAYSYGEDVLATQWHPERMLEEGMLPIFTWFIGKASASVQKEEWL